METQSPPWTETLGRMLGFLAVWVLMTLALTLASRTIQLGPGFHNPLPYALIALGMAQTGRFIRKWLHP